MRIISRYIFKEAALYFCISLFAFTAILLTLRMLKFAALIINKGVEVQQILWVFVAIIPTFLEIALPMATLLGIMLAFARLSGDSEVIVMRASGISITQLITPVIAFGLLSAAASLYVSLELRPWGFQTLSSTLFEIARSKTTSGLNEGVFNKLGDMTLYAEQINFQNGQLRNVLIDDRRAESDRKIVSAREGFIDSDALARTITLYLKDGSIHEINEGKYVLTDFTRNSLLLDSNEINEDSDNQKEAQPRELYRSDLQHLLADSRLQLNALRSDGIAASPTPAPTQMVTQVAPGVPIPAPSPLDPKVIKRRVQKIETEMGRRLSMPYAAFILALVAMPLGIHPARAQKTWGIGLSAALGLAVFIFYYALLSVGVALAESGRIDPLIALWIPNLGATLIAVFMLYKVSTEQWQSINQGVEQLLAVLAQPFRALQRLGNLWRGNR